MGRTNGGIGLYRTLSTSPYRRDSRLFGLNPVLRAAGSRTERIRFIGLGRIAAWLEVAEASAMRLQIPASVVGGFVLLLSSTTSFLHRCIACGGNYFSGMRAW